MRRRTDERALQGALAIADNAVADAYCCVLGS